MTTQQTSAMAYANQCGTTSDERAAELIEALIELDVATSDQLIDAVAEEDRIKAARRYQPLIAALKARGFFTPIGIDHGGSVLANSAQRLTHSEQATDALGARLKDAPADMCVRMLLMSVWREWCATHVVADAAHRRVRRVLSDVDMFDKLSDEQKAVLRGLLERQLEGQLFLD